MSYCSKHTEHHNNCIQCVWSERDDAIDRAEEAEAELAEAKDAISNFCHESDWADPEWKKQYHIAKLFEINERGKDGNNEHNA